MLVESAVASKSRVRLVALVPVSTLGGCVETPRNGKLVAPFPPVRWIKIEMPRPEY
jgi:hypothetical protein